MAAYYYKKKYCFAGLLQTKYFVKNIQTSKNIEMVRKFNINNDQIMNLNMRAGFDRKLIKQNYGR